MCDYIGNLKICQSPTLSGIIAFGCHIFEGDLLSSSMVTSNFSLGIAFSSSRVTSNILSAFSVSSILSWRDVLDNKINIFFIEILDFNHKGED